MRGFLCCLFGLLALSTFVNASPYAEPKPNPMVVAPRQTEGAGDPIVGEENPSTSTTEEAAASSSTEEAKGTVSNTTKKGSGSATTNITQKSGSASGTKKGSNTVYDPRSPPGSVVMQTPALTDGAQYYKIKDYVTFSWNYTNLLATPTAVDIQAYCSKNAQMYPIAANVSIKDTEVIWDTLEYEATATVHLVQESYVLYIYDAAKESDANPSAGYLAPYNSFQFAMYKPKEYTPLSQYQCATCGNSATALADPKVLRMMVAVSVITALSFTWFVAGIAW